LKFKKYPFFESLATVELPQWDCLPIVRLQLSARLAAVAEGAGAFNS
jgi:hypothetical protein